jgi:hypothetical protein
MKNVLKGKPKNQNDAVCQNSKGTHYLKKQDKYIVKQGKYHTTGHQRYHANTAKPTT